MGEADKKIRPPVSGIKPREAQRQLPRAGRASGAVRSGWQAGLQEEVASRCICGMSRSRPDGGRRPSASQVLDNERQGPWGLLQTLPGRLPAPGGASASHTSIPRLQVCSPHPANCELPKPCLPLMSVTLETQTSS